jgi:hypothetical protein
MADNDERRTPAAELAFQPFDGGEIEMVGGLVQQQDIGRGRQHTGQRGAAGLPPEICAGSSSPWAELFQDVPGLIMVVAGAEAGFDIGQRGGEAFKIRLLW